MYYEPKFFTPQEFFSKEVWDQEHHKGSQIWRLMDGRILWTADRIREHFCGKETRNSIDSMTINNWSWGGQRQYSGYRDIYIDIILEDNNFSRTSQHCFGRAMDYIFGRTTPEEVQADILNNPEADRYKFITGLELETETWTHNDTRSWDKSASGIFTFKP
jgi:hypothetical protein